MSNGCSKGENLWEVILFMNIREFGMTWYMKLLKNCGFRVGGFIILHVIWVLIFS